MKNVKYCNLNSNKIEWIPAAINEMEALTDLDVSNNALAPKDMPNGQKHDPLPVTLGVYIVCIIVMYTGELSKLEKLNLSRNTIVVLPAELGNLTLLTRLDISHNELTSIPKSFGSLVALTWYLCVYASVITYA